MSIDLATWHYNENDTYVSWPDEADLDLDVAYPIIYPQTTTIYQVDDEYYNLHSANGYFGIFNTFLDAIDGVSISQSLLIKHRLSPGPAWGTFSSHFVSLTNSDMDG